MKKDIKNKIIPSFRISSDLHKEIINLSEKSFRNIQDQIRWLIKQGIEYEKKINPDTFKKGEANDSQGNGKE